MKHVSLGIYANLRGIAFACMEMPDTLLDSGICSPRPYDTDKLLARVEKLLNFYSPSVVVLRDANKVDSIRMRNLINRITECAIERGISVHQYAREQTKQVFTRFGATTKQEIADCIIREWLPELSIRRPKPRGIWEPEDYYMGVFDSLALIMTHEFIHEDKKA